MELPVTFGEWLRQSRDRLRLTRGEFAERVGCSVSMIRKIEDSDRRPSVQIAELIANCLDIPAADRPTFVKVARGELSLDRLVPIAQRMSGPGVIPVQPHPRIQLPILPTPIIGRQRDVEQLSQLLHDPQCSLLTLVGPGGIGKTRLAIEAASQVQDFFTDGVSFVSLASVNSSSFIVPMIADAIGFAFQPENVIDPQTQLFNYLREKHALLLLDNFEHLLAEPGIRLLSEMLGHAPQVKLLVTSRASLDLYGEWIYEVQGLPVPESGQTTFATQGTSVELFLQRARRAHVRFNATTQDYPAIVRICQLVGGMPLGIELAAAWVRTLSCDEIAREIERGLDFLNSYSRDLPARHRSMQAVFEHSWELLSEEEQQVLLRLSVFQSGFQREAAELIAGATLPILSAFVTKSLVRRTAAGRYDLHELIRQYAYERLAQLKEEKIRTQARHGRYYLEYFGNEDNNLRSSAQAESLASLTVEMDNFRTAWDWAIANAEFILIEQALRAFATYFDSRGWFQDGFDLLGRAAKALDAAIEASPPGRDKLVTRGHLLACRGLLAFRLGRNDQAREMLEISLEILRPINEPRVLVESLTFLAIVMAMMGEVNRAIDLFGEGLEIANRIGDRWFAALCFTEQVGMQIMLGNSENAYEQLESAVADWRVLGDPRFTAFGLNSLSLSAFGIGRFEEARRALEESIQLNRSVGDRWGLGTAYRVLGLVAQAQEDHPQAVEAFQQSVNILKELGARWDVARVLAEMGRSVFALGNSAEAEQIWLESLRLSIDAQAEPVGLEALVGLANLQAKRGEYETALELVLIVLNQPACIQETKNRALNLREQLTFQMSPEEMELIELQAREKSFNSTAEDLFGRR